MNEVSGHGGTAGNQSSQPAEANGSGKPEPALHVLEVRALQGATEETGVPPRRKYYGLFVNEEPVHELVMQRRDMVRFVMPDRTRGIVTFLPSEDPEIPTPHRENGPFGANGIYVRGERTVRSTLSQLPTGARFRWSFTIYLQDRDHLVDGNSTPVIIIRDPGP